LKYCRCWSLLFLLRGHKKELGSKSRYPDDFEQVSGYLFARLRATIFEQVEPSFLFPNFFFCEALPAQKIAQKKQTPAQESGGGLGWHSPKSNGYTGFSP